VKRRIQQGSRAIPLQAARDLPGAFGDPLRVLEALPGVVPWASGLPYGYVRGAPPAAIGYVFDDIPLPQLFHAAFGPAVIHPRMTGSVRLYGGVPDARYGRRAGGLFLAEGTPQKDRFGAEAELRLLDAGGWIESPLGKGVVTFSGRIGYPRLAFLAAEQVGAVDKGSTAAYYDGQLRYRVQLSQRDRVEVVWLGSYDSVKLPGISNDPAAGATDLQFQRVETRYVRKLRHAEFGTALRFGYDTSALGSALQVSSLQFGPRFWSTFQLGRIGFRVGGDLFGMRGRVRNGTGALGGPEGDIQIRLPPFAAASARNQGGVYVESNIPLWGAARADLGLRIDYWSAQSKIDVGVDPRLRILQPVTDALDLHAAVGLAHQPAVFLLPVPGLTDVALSQGLTQTVQSEVGAAYQLPRDTSVELTGFVNHYQNLLLPELLQDGYVPDNPPLVTANSYGIEVFLRHTADRMTGWVSYTLASAMADSGPDVVGKFRPDFDVRHVLNVIGQFRVWRGLQIGGRVHARSGRVVEQLNPSYTQRLPWFVRLDARIGYSWEGRFAKMVAYVEWLNFLARREYLDADCFLGQCTANVAPPISLPNIGVRADF
jgi:TonB dependent receptor